MYDLHIKQNRNICSLIYEKKVSTFRIFQNINIYFMAFLWGHYYTWHLIAQKVQCSRTRPRTIDIILTVLELRLLPANKVC